MRAVVQKVIKGNVSVNSNIISSIDKGLVVLVGISVLDNIDDVFYIADKITNLRIFEDNNQKLNLSVLDVKGEILLVSQFTLLGDVRKGRRPNFMNAAKPEMALYYFNKLNDELKHYGINTKTGEFGSMMKVSLINDGPVTILLDSKRTF